MPSSNIFESDSFHRRVVEKLAEYRDRLLQDEVSVWQQISLDLSNECELNYSDLRWQDLSRYFKQSLVFKLSHRRLTDDQGLIDRLQYPYLRKVYVVTIKFYERCQLEGEHGRSENSGEVEDNKLFIKYSMDGRYDPDVVGAFRRRSRKGKRIYVNINVADPAYNLPGDVKKLLLQMEHNRKERTHHHIEANREERESSPVVLDGVPVAIEDGSPQEKEFSARDLLEKESFSVNTQEYDHIIMESLEREQLLSPVPKRCRVDSFEPHGVEVWLESNLSTTSSLMAAARGHQEDPLHTSGRSETQRLDLSESVAGVSSVSMQAVSSQPLTLIMASQPNSSHEMVPIKQEPLEEEQVVNTVGKSSDVTLDLISHDEVSEVSRDALIGPVEPIAVNNESITTARSQCSSKSIGDNPDQGSSVVQFQQSVQVKLEPAETDIKVDETEEVHDWTLPPDFFSDTSDSDDEVESEESVAKVAAVSGNADEMPMCRIYIDNVNLIENQDADSTSLGVARGTSDPVPNRTVAQTELVHIKQEGSAKDEESDLPPDFFYDYSTDDEATEVSKITRDAPIAAVVPTMATKMNNISSARRQCCPKSDSTLPPDFFSDASHSDAGDDEVECEAIPKIAAVVGNADELPISRIDMEDVSSRKSSTTDNSRNLTVIENREADSTSPGCVDRGASDPVVGIIECQQDLVQITQGEKANLNVEDSGLPLDLFSPSIKEESSDDAVASKAAEESRSTRESDKNHSISRDSSRTSPAPVALDQEDEESENNGTISVVHQLATKRISLLNDSVSGTPMFNNSLESVPLHCIMKKRRRLRTPLGDVDQNVLLSNVAAAATEYGLAPDGRLPNHDRSVCAPESLDLPADEHSTHEPGPENRNHATASNQSNDSCRLFVSFDSGTTEVPKESPPMATSPTAIAPNFQQRHESLQPVIESRLRFQAVLRSCWPELFSKSGIFGDFYELLSILAVNLFPRVRPTDFNRVMALGPMFSAIASRIVFGTCPQTAPQQSTRAVVVDATNGERSGASQHSDGNCCGVVDGHIDGCTGEIDEESTQNNCPKKLPEVPIIEISDDSDPEDLPVRKKREYRVRQCSQNKHGNTSVSDK